MGEREDEKPWRDANGVPLSPDDVPNDPQLEPQPPEHRAVFSDLRSASLDELLNALVRAERGGAH